MEQRIPLVGGARTFYWMFAYLSRGNRGCNYAATKLVFIPYGNAGLMRNHCGAKSEIWIRF